MKGSFSKKIHEKNKWRELELENIGDNILKEKKEENIISKLDEEKDLLILRGLYCMIYAHWQGIVKDSIESFLEHFNNIKLHISDSTTLSLFMFANGEGKDIKKEEILIAAMNKIKKNRNEIIQFSEIKKICEKLVRTTNNKALKNFYKQFNFKDKKKPDFTEIDKIIETRNKFAHGEYEEEGGSGVTKDDIRNCIKTIMSLSDKFITSLDEYIENEDWKDGID